MFIVFEGADGSGKTTQLQRLAQVLRDRGVGVVTTREPGGSPSLGGPLRELLLHTGGDIGAHAEALLFAAERAEHVRLLIGPALAAGKVVLCDRFVDSTLAYQGAGRGLPEAELLALCDFATGGRTPDLTVVCDVSPQVAASRQQARAAADRMEAAGLGEPVRDLLLRRAAQFPHRYAVVDADRDIDAVAGDVTTLVLSALAGRAAA